MALSVLGGFGSKGGGSNPNLLDNGWFTINQRGATSYSSPSSGVDTYSVDRWYVFNGSVVVEDGYITITRNNNAIASFGFNSRLEKNLNLTGKTVTLSFMMSDGVILSQTGSFPEGETGNNALNFSYGNTDWIVNLGSRSTFYQVAIYLPNAGDAISIRAIKLEYGSNSTLALDSAPNYTTELLKCQRYYRKYRFKMFEGYANSNTQIIFGNDFGDMRTKPTITISGGYSYVTCNGVEQSLTSSKTLSISYNNGGYPIGTLTGFTISSKHLCVALIDTYEASADL